LEGLMKRTEQRDSVTEFERGLKRPKKEKYVLRLYVTGMTEQSKQTIQCIKKICEDYLKGNYELEVIDIYREPVLAKGDQIVATRTLIKKLPVPMRKFIGDMSEKDKILLGLDLRPKGLAFGEVTGISKSEKDYEKR
jgi:circadian clock protein KaiB